MTEHEHADGEPATTFELEYVFERDDLVAWMRYLAARSWRARLTWYSLWGFFGVAAGLFLPFVFIHIDRALGGKPVDPPYRPYVFGVVVGTATMTFMAWSGRKKALDHLAEEWTKQNPGLQTLGPRKMTVSRSRIAVVREQEEIAQEWPSVTEIAETGTHVFVCANRAFIIPKRAFVGEHACMDFVQSIRQWWCRAKSPQ